MVNCVVIARAVILIGFIILGEFNGQWIIGKRCRFTYVGRYSYLMPRYQLALLSFVISVLLELEYISQHL